MKRSFTLLFLILTIVICEQCISGSLTEEQLINLSLDCFNQKYNSDTHDGHKLSRLIQSKVTSYKKILQHIRMDKKQHIQTSPVIKWAQNKQKIFINFKLSHRQDSPPCSDVRHQQFVASKINEIQGKFNVKRNQNQTESSRIDFTSECFFTDQKFLFRLSLAFNATLKSINIERQGFGSYTLVGEKNESGIWIDPFEDVERTAIWQQMRERYESEMNEYFEMREHRKESSSNKNKRKKKKRSYKKQAQQKIMPDEL